MSDIWVSPYPQVRACPVTCPRSCPPGEGGGVPVKGAEGAREALDRGGDAPCFLCEKTGAQRLLDSSKHK